MTPGFHDVPVLVTGGSGFIGTHLVEELTSSGARVTNADVRPPNLHGHRGLWQRCDLRDRACVQELVASTRPEVVYHLAATTDIAQGPEALAVNTTGLANLIAGVRALDSACLLVNTSTQLVMRPGHVPQHALDFDPYSEYGQSKADAEMLLHEQGDGLDWVVIRPANVWGPWHPTFADQIWRYIERGYYLHPRGHDPRRSYGYVANVVHQVLRLFTVNRQAVRGETFYVGDEPIPSSLWLDTFSRALRGRPVRRVPPGLLQVAATLGEVSGRLGGPAPIDRGRLYRMSTDYAVPMERTFAVLGAGPVCLDDGVRETVAWLRGRSERP